jgi:hypothetical protein
VTELPALFDWNIPGAYLQGPALAAALAAFGLVVGVLTGLFGVGGGFMITPLLSIGFGIRYDLVIGSSLSFTIGTASSGMSRHMRLGNFEPRATLILALASMAGALAGGTLNDAVQAALGAGQYSNVIDTLYVALLTLTAWVVARESTPHPTGKTLLQRLPLGPRVDLPTAKLTGVSLPGLLLVGLAIGLLSGMLGIGGGVLFMPLLVVALGLTPHQAVGTSLGVVVFGATAGTIKYGLAGKVNLVIVMALLVSSVFGVQLGAWICHRLHATHLRRYFALLVALVAVVVAVRLGASLLSG